MPTAPDLRRELFAAQGWCAELVAGTTDEQLNTATPCPEFDVRRLIAHIALVFEKIVAFGETRRDPQFGQGIQPADIARINDELKARYVDSHQPAQRAEMLQTQIELARPLWTEALLDENIQLGWGPNLPGRAVAAIYLMECLAHGWDLAIATGQGAEAPKDVAQAGLAAAKAGLPAEPRGVEVGVPFAPPVASSADAGPTEQLANWTGRSTS